MWFGGQRRIDDLEEDLRRLKRDFQALELEWGNVYDKVRKAMHRVVKSAAIISKSELSEEQAGAEPPVSETPGSFLTVRQKTIQQSILRRRANGGVS